MAHRGKRAAGEAGSGSGAVLEAPAFVAGLDDLAVVGEPVEQGCGHLGVAEDGRPLAEGGVCGDDGGGALVEPAHEVEEELPAGLGEGQVAEFVEDDEVAAGELLCGAALASGAEFGLEVVDQVDGVVATATGALSDAGPGDGCGEMGLAGACRNSHILPAIRAIQSRSTTPSTRVRASAWKWFGAIGSKAS